MRTYERDARTNVKLFFTVLTHDQAVEADYIGVLRYEDARRKGRRNRAGFYVGVDLADKLGARCELGAAKILGVAWNVPYDQDLKVIHAHADVGGYQIRGTPCTTGCLPIRKWDADEQIFILAIEEELPESPANTYRITLKGWALARDAKKHDEWIKNYRGGTPAWFMPQDALRPMADLEPTLMAAGSG